MDTDTTLRARADASIRVGAFSIDILVQGFPGKTVCHGGLGWSTVALVRGEGRVVLVDAGNFGMRRLIAGRLEAHGLKPSDVTDVILTHAHYDHSINWPMFSASRVLIGKQELEWAVAQRRGGRGGHPGAHRLCGAWPYAGASRLCAQRRRARRDLLRRRGEEPRR